METLAIVVLYVLAIYGIIQIGLDIISMCIYNKMEADSINVCVFVKNQEDKVEYFLKSLIFNTIEKNRDKEVSKVYVCDMGSTDDTIEIINKLSKESNYIEIIDRNNIEEMFDKGKDSV